MLHKDDIGIDDKKRGKSEKAGSTDVSAGSEAQPKNETGEKPENEAKAQPANETKVKPENETKAQPDKNAAADKKSNEEKLKEQLSKKESEANEFLEHMQRLAAEYDNFRKRTQREKEKLYIDAVVDIVSKFLPVVDNIERALKAAEDEESKGLKEGVSLTYRQLLDILTKLGVQPIEAQGKNFDPELHNAVMHVEDEAQDKNIVVEEFQKGYIYKDGTVIRHSMVKVAN